MPQQTATVYVTNLPPYSIIMWYNALSALPAGWVLCDGTNNTPDLRDRFVAGAGYSYVLGFTGGYNSVVLTTDQIPSHSHTISQLQPMNGFWQVPNAGNSHNVMTPLPGAVSTDPTGDGRSHENRPPFMALYYIMKTP